MQVHMLARASLEVWMGTATKDPHLNLFSLFYSVFFHGKRLGWYALVMHSWRGAGLKDRNTTTHDGWMRVGGFGWVHEMNGCFLRGTLYPGKGMVGVSWKKGKGELSCSGGQVGVSRKWLVRLIFSQSRVLYGNGALAGTLSSFLLFTSSLTLLLTLHAVMFVPLYHTLLLILLLPVSFDKAFLTFWILRLFPMQGRIWENGKDGKQKSKNYDWKCLYC